jgi:putative oxidoreductase
MSITTPSSPVHRVYALLVVWASRLQSPLLLAIRLYWGWHFFRTGLAKLQDHMTFTEQFIGFHVPLPGLSVWLAGTTECAGGLLLLIGLASRLAAVPLIFTMIVAYLTADLEAVQGIFSAPDKFLEAAPFLFLFACLIVLAFGPGVFSIDHLLARRFGSVHRRTD